MLFTLCNNNKHSNLNLIDRHQFPWLTVSIIENFAKFMSIWAISGLTFKEFGVNFCKSKAFQITLP